VKLELRVETRCRRLIRAASLGFERRFLGVCKLWVLCGVSYTQLADELHYRLYHERKKRMDCAKWD
jgi:hypothetical protein